MHVEQWHWRPGSPWPLTPTSSANLVFAFGSTEILADPSRYEALRAAYPDAHIVGCSTGGEILGPRVDDGTLAVTAVRFERSSVALASALLDGDDGAETGRRLGRDLRQQAPARLAHVFVLADGLRLNRSAFVRGLEAELPEGVPVSGGLAADGSRFERTPLWADGLLPGPGALAVGLCGEHLRVGCGAVGGWDPFGPDRLVTHAEGSVLHTLDDRSALDLYKAYLGPYADRLPAAGLLFPLGIRNDAGDHEIVRSALDIDDEAGTITFAGEIPQGSYARFMKTNVERIIDGAVAASRAALDDAGEASGLALFVSCVGRKWVLGQRTEEEVEAAAEVLGAGVPITGFYSYGEYAPVQSGASSTLHNQTMTVTMLAEV